jgi:hypothetical protein
MYYNKIEFLRELIIRNSALPVYVTNKTVFYLIL